MKLRPEDTDLVGEWIEVDGRVEQDAIALWIHDLVAGALAWMATSPDGWSSLYEDPQDGRLWKLWYPRSEMHGGGPPRLTHLTWREAQMEFGEFGADVER